MNHIELYLVYCQYPVTNSCNRNISSSEFKTKKKSVGGEEKPERKENTPVYMKMTLFCSIYLMKMKGSI